MLSYLGNGISFPIAYTGDIKASGVAFPAIGLILIILRALLHISKKASVGLAEAFAVFSWLNIVGMGVVFVWSADNGGLGWPTPTNEPTLTATYISPSERNSALSEYVFLILRIVALGTTKLSLLFFFRKIFVSGHRTIWTQLSLVLVATVTLWTTAFTLGFILVCGGNPTAFWNPGNIRRECLQITGGYSMLEKASLITDLILDVACILLPIPIVRAWPTRYKVILTAVFMVGIMTIIAGAARLVIWIQILETAGEKNEDLNLAVTLALQSGMIETGLAFIVSQLPPLAAYLKKSTRGEIAETIRYAASVISLRSSDSTGSKGNKAETVRQQSVVSEQHELDKIGRDDTYEVTVHNEKRSKASGGKGNQAV